MSCTICRICGRGNNQKECCGRATDFDEFPEFENNLERFEEAIQLQGEKSRVAEAEWQRREAARLKAAYEEQIAPMSIREMEKIKEHLSWAIVAMRSSPDQSDLRKMLLEAKALTEKRIDGMRWKKDAV